MPLQHTRRFISNTSPYIICYRESNIYLKGAYFMWRKPSFWISVVGVIAGLALTSGLIPGDTLTSQILGMLASLAGSAKLATLDPKAK